MHFKILKSIRQGGYQMGMVDTHDGLYFYTLTKTKLWVGNELGQQWYDTTELVNRHMLTLIEIFECCFQRTPEKIITTPPWGVHEALFSMQD